MATRARSRSTALALRPASSAPARRAGPSPKLVKLEARLAQAARKTRDVAGQNEDLIFTVGVPAALGLLRANGKTLPSVGGFHPMLVWGAPLALLGEKIVGGKWGKRARAAGIGMLACAANDAAHRGTLKAVAVAGDEIGADDDEVGADDDDD